MVYAAIGGMQLTHWTAYLKIIGPTFRVLKSAKKTDGCVKAEMFKSGQVYFAVSVWDSVEQMRAFAQGGLHGKLTDMAMDNMALFYNHTHAAEKVPTRAQTVAIWHAAMDARAGKGTVGQLTT